MLFQEMGMEFKDKIILYCFKKVNCQQGSTTGIWYNVLKWSHKMYISGLMVNKSEIKCGSPESFFGNGGYKFA